MNVGIHLFQLDADSFERCVYLRHTAGFTSLSTDGIRAKLGNLVEDTDDMNNYEKAMHALRDRRNAYSAYRRSDGEAQGSAAAASREVSRLEGQLDERRRRDKELQALNVEIGRLESTVRKRTEEVESVRERLTQTSEAAAREEIRKRYADLESDRVREQAALDELAAGGIPPKEELSRKMEEFARVQELNRENNQIAAPSTASPYSLPMGNHLWIVALLTGFLSEIVGAVLLSHQHYVFGGLLLACGVAAFLVGAYLLLEQRMFRQVSVVSGIRHISGLERERILSNETEIQRLEQSLSDFAARYRAAGRTTPDALAELRLRRGQYDGQDERLHNAIRRRDAFAREHRDVLNAPPEKTNPATLRREKERLENELMEGTQTLRERQHSADILRREVEQIPDLEEELADWRKKQTEDQKKSELLDRTMGFLEQARENLSLRYLNTVRRGFENYTARLLKEEWARSEVDPALRPSVVRAGQTRELTAFSAGETDLLMLCMRLALADALFAEERPFLILDDPFVNLDGKNTEKALAVLADLARDHQILYLTCHNSRTLS